MANRVSTAISAIIAFSGDAFIVMDVDLQDPPELVAKMVEKWKKGYDVVDAQRKNRAGETWIKTVVSALGYKVINRIR